MRRGVRQNGLSLVMFAAFVVFLVLQSVFGWQKNNQNLADHGRALQPYWSYLGSGEFIEATFENWESEFLQMGSYVLLAAYLVQRGSPESKPLDEKPGESSREPISAASPAPAKRGGVVLWLYENRLSQTRWTGGQGIRGHGIRSRTQPIGWSVDLGARGGEAEQTGHGSDSSLAG